MSIHCAQANRYGSLLANPLECTAVDLLQVGHVRQHLVAKGAPDARASCKGGRILCPVGSDEWVDAGIPQGQGTLWRLGTVLLACSSNGG